jgi:allophanate hydrolase
MVDSLAPLLDLGSMAQTYRTVTTHEVVDRLYARIKDYPDPAVWIHLLPKGEVHAQADAVQARRAAGAELPLFGVPFAVKDNIDVGGMPTTAACPAFRYIAPKTATVVQRLLDAGALLIGKTNLDQFATGVAGDRTPYGVCRNPFAQERIAGGSSSGSAVAVAAGLVSFALGTDTAGSGRVPAGCTNIIGLKPTPGLLPSDGMVPACQSLDCVSVFALSVADARVIFEILQGSKPEGVPQASSSDLSFAIPRREDLEFYGDGEQTKLFDQSVQRLKELGGKLCEFDYRPFREVAQLLYEGPWVAERWAAVGDFIQKNRDVVHPVTREIIQEGSKYTAAELFRAQYQLKALRERCLEVFERAAVLVVPTMPTVPTIAEVLADSRNWGRRLGYYTNFVNLLGLAAIAIPAGFTQRGLPGGITLIGPAGSERKLCEVGQAWQGRLNLPVGATGRRIEQPSVVSGATANKNVCPTVRLAVAGAHLRGQPLHPELLKTGARFVRACKTASGYRFCAFMDLNPPKPGLLRDDAGAGAIDVEIYELPIAGFGALVQSVAPPLAIGTVILEDGEAVKGFLCESFAAQQARDITSFGGWVAFREAMANGEAGRSHRSGGSQ